jgi:hypothetical protein
MKHSVSTCLIKQGFIRLSLIGDSSLPPFIR